jgi:hypothetical protein
VATALAVAAQLAAGHGHEWSIGAINDLEISDDKSIFNCDGAEASQAIF